MILSREISVCVASAIVHYCVASISGLTTHSKSGLKYARDKVNYLRFRNYASNTLYKSKMSGILLEVILSVVLVLKFNYKYMGDTILA